MVLELKAPDEPAFWALWPLTRVASTPPIPLQFAPGGRLSTARFCMCGETDENECSLPPCSKTQLNELTT